CRRVQRIFTWMDHAARIRSIPPLSVLQTRDRRHYGSAGWLAVLVGVFHARRLRLPEPWDPRRSASDVSRHGPAARGHRLSDPPRPARQLIRERRLGVACLYAHLHAGWAAGPEGPGHELPLGRLRPGLGFRGA